MPPLHAGRGSLVPCLGHIYAEIGAKIQVGLPLGAKTAPGGQNDLIADVVPHRTGTGGGGKRVMV
jgi:hypothetical protein